MDKIPDVVAAGYTVTRPLDPLVPPTIEQAVHMYEHEGGNLSREAVFGNDPLANNQALTQHRHEIFTETYPSFQEIFEETLKGNSQPLGDAILLFRDLTRRFAGNNLH